MTSRNFGKGWNALANPVPGNMHEALKELHVWVAKEQGDELSALCPMHLTRTGKTDRRPSWSVNKVSGVFNCFSCGYKGPFVQLVTDVLETDRATAAAWVQARGSVERVRDVLRRQHDGDERPATPGVNEADLALMEVPPRAELRRRRLSYEAVQKHGVLWDPSPPKRCWILPIRHPQTHELWGWQEKNDRFFRNRPASVTKSKTLFGLDAFEGDTAILVESPLDAVRLTSVGIPGGLATYGAAVSDEQMHLATAVAENIIVALDNPNIDRAGRVSAEQLRKKWANRGFTMSYLNYTDIPVKDIGEMADAQIRKAIKNAESAIFARFPC